MSALLSAENVFGGYASAEHVVKGVTFGADAGELVSVIGPNGAGKSTALKLVAGLLRLSDGSVRVDGENLAGRSAQAVARAGLGFVPQERNVFGALTVAENLEMGCLFEPRQARPRMAEAFERFPMLAEKRRAAARVLSGGQRQVLAVAMALMGRPRVLLLDEPTAGLSPKAAGELFALVRAVADSGIAVLMVEQNALDALEISDRAYVLVDGRNHGEGSARQVAGDPDIRRLFLGGRSSRNAGECP